MWCCCCYCRCCRGECGSTGSTMVMEVCRVGLLFSTQVENLHSIFTLGNDVEIFPQKFAQMEINLHKWKLISICANRFPPGGNWFPFVQIYFHLCKSISTQRTRHFSIQRMSHYKLNGYEYRFAFSTAVSFLVISPNIVSATSVTLTCHTVPVTSGILQ